MTSRYTHVHVPVSDPSHSQSINIPNQENGAWIATLSNGNTIVEHEGEFSLRTGELTPWVRLTHFLIENDLYLTSLKLNFRGRTIQLPSTKFDRFNLETKKPDYYSLQYHIEAVQELGAGPFEQVLFVDLAAHYPDFAVHFIQDVTNGNDSWVVITDPEALAPTPNISFKS
jgi:hypothetical protein